MNKSYSYENVVAPTPQAISTHIERATARSARESAQATDIHRWRWRSTPLAAAPAPQHMARRPAAKGTPLRRGRAVLTLMEDVLCWAECSAAGTGRLKRDGEPGFFQ